MKISTILDHIDSGHMALPEFQRGYVWNRDQVRGLFDSLYRRHPVGGLLVWATESKTAAHRGDGALAAGVVKLLLDGQQRMTSLYGVVRGRAPQFFDGNTRAFTGLRFHLETETFGFYQPVKMKGDPLWTEVTELMQKGTAGLGEFVTRLTEQPALAPKVGDYVGRLSRLLGIVDVDLHVEEVTGADKSLDVVVNIFNRVNSGGTKLSKGDLALAKICAEWPEGRDAMKVRLKEWNNAGYHFTLDWLLRSVNTVLTGEAKFQHLHEKSATEVQDALARATKHIDTSLNFIGGRLGLDHDQVFFGRFGVPVMVRYLDQRQAKQRGAMGAKERDKLLFWFVQAAMWGRFSGSTESFIDQDLAALEGDDGGLDKLLEQLRLWHGGLRAEPGHFTGWSLGARFYPVLYLLTRMGEAKDWGNGLALKAGLLGKMSSLEVHHIFPKARLYKCKYRRPEVNALANFCFQTKDTNLEISDRLPEEYFRSSRHVTPAACRHNGSRWTRHSGRWNGFGTSSKPGRSCWRRSSTGVWRICCTATPGGSRVRGGRACAGPCPWRHHERGGRGTAGIVERVDGGRRLPPRCGVLRLLGPGVRRTEGGLRSRVAERHPGGAEPARGCVAERGRADAGPRQSSRVPVLHGRRRVQALRHRRDPRRGRRRLSGSGRFHDHRAVARLHLHVDDVMLRTLARLDIGGYRREGQRARTARWSKLDSKGYERLIQLIRLCLRGEPLWMVEQYWQGHQ